MPLWHFHGLYMIPLSENSRLAHRSIRLIIAMLPMQHFINTEHMFKYYNPQNVQFSSVPWLIESLSHTEDDSAEILFQRFLQEANVSSSGMGRDVHSLMLSIQHFLCPPRRRPPSMVPWRMFFGEAVTCPNHASFTTTGHNKQKPVTNIQYVTGKSTCCLLVSSFTPLSNNAFSSRF